MPIAGTEQTVWRRKRVKDLSDPEAAPFVDFVDLYGSTPGTLINDPVKGAFAYSLYDADGNYANVKHDGEWKEASGLYLKTHPVPEDNVNVALITFLWPTTPGVYTQETKYWKSDDEDLSILRRRIQISA